MSLVQCITITYMYNTDWWGLWWCLCHQRLKLMSTLSIMLDREIDHPCLASLCTIRGRFLGGGRPLGVLIIEGGSKWAELLFLIPVTRTSGDTMEWQPMINTCCRRASTKRVVNCDTVARDLCSFSRFWWHFRHTCPLGRSCILDAPSEASPIRPSKAAMAYCKVERVRRFVCRRFGLGRDHTICFGCCSLSSFFFALR